MNWMGSTRAMRISGLPSGFSVKFQPEYIH